MTMTSYQRRKKEIEELQAEVYRLRRMIADDDKEAMLIVKKQVQAEDATEAAIWAGDITKETGGNYDGIIKMMKA